MYISKNKFLIWLESIPPEAEVIIKEVLYWNNTIHVTARWHDHLGRGMARSILLEHKAKWALKLVQTYKERTDTE